MILESSVHSGSHIYSEVLNKKLVWNRKHGSHCKISSSQEVEEENEKGEAQTDLGGKLRDNNLWGSSEEEYGKEQEVFCVVGKIGVELRQDNNMIN